MPAENGSLHVGQYRVIKAKDPREQLLLFTELLDQVAAKFFLDAEWRIAGSLQFT